MMLTPAQAAKAVGMTKAGIIRAIHKGKLSATCNTDGHFEIDPAELFRVYEPVSIGVKSDEEIDGNAGTHHPRQGRNDCRLADPP